MSWQNRLSCLLTHELPFNLDLLPPHACLVGGAVRDALLNRQRDYLDLDFVVPQLAVETAREIAKTCHAGFVILDQQRQIARIVFTDATVDFALQEGETVESDLHRRDFTINAIAYNPHTSELIDPLNGLKDLEQGILRMVSQSNLEDDPLRLLRAYRQAAQLHLTIEPTTRSTIALLAPLLSQVAAERVQTELGYLLSHPQGTYWLIEAWKDGILQPWLKNITSEKVQLLTQIEPSAQALQKHFNRQFDRNQDLILAKLTCLVSGDSQVAELELMDLKYSRAEIRTVTTALKYLPELQQTPHLMSLREQYFFFLHCGKVFPIIAILAMAHGVEQKSLFPIIKRYLDPSDPVAHPQCLVTGNDLMRDLNLNPSPLIGQLLTEIQIAQIEQKIGTVDEALNFAQDLANSRQDKF
ncbi:CCA tRNA nucleotidyltransferase [Gloeothece verrucosa]|uniref:Polynucleotide adenylyltransferase region n=1 Tax=Gloeothece verrucosa (strain PCC 7822) TaxID=497965 RepID=E0UF27_GLOV7|nr:CCA tRNA nucleotidyltransferase [Gloeothece verrucosa]ADN14279.1 Polynucleotide adenylyltransferase region [Gloeothece verrucosa PCC 7822]